MEYVIETRSLTKRFPNKTAVNKADMHGEKGAIYGLIGKNGAGKTTAMKMLLGIIAPTEGEITLFGSKDLAAERRRIGSLIEAPGIYKGPVKISVDTVDVAHTGAAGGSDVACAVELEADTHLGMFAKRSIGR